MPCWFPWQRQPTIPFDGLIGAAKSQLSNQNNTTPIESLAAQGLVPAAQMGYKLGRVGDGPNDGQATFGGVDTTKFEGQLVEVPNVSQVGFFEGEPAFRFSAEKAPTWWPPVG